MYRRVNRDIVAPVSIVIIALCDLARVPRPEWFRRPEKNVDGTRRHSAEPPAAAGSGAAAASGAAAGSGGRRSRANRGKKKRRRSRRTASESDSESGPGKVPTSRSVAGARRSKRGAPRRNYAEMNSGGDGDGDDDGDGGDGSPDDAGDSMDTGGD